MKNIDSVMRERFQRQQQDESRIHKQEIKELERMKAAAYAGVDIPEDREDLHNVLERIGLRRGIDYEIT